MKTAIDQKKLKKVMVLDLRQGAGKSLAESVCVMQAVDYVTSGGFSDHPECSCPVLTGFAIRLNDRMDNESRQRLKPLIPKLVGTNDGKSKERFEFLVHHAITVTLSMLVDALGMNIEAAKLKSFSIGQWKEMEEFCRSIRGPMRATMKKKTDSADAAAYASAAASDAYAYACASAYASACASAYASDAASEACASAYASASDACASAYASAYADKRGFWRDVRKNILDSGIEALTKACEIR